MTKYLIHINEACHEDWDAMTPSEQGRFCASCNKSVLDFTNASDKDIISYLKSTKGNMFCGKFEVSQLDRWMFENDIKKSNPALYKMLLGVLLLTSSQSINAQKAIKEDILIAKQQKDTINIPETIKQKTVSTQDTPVKNDSCVSFRIGGARTITTYDAPLYVIDGKLAKDKVLSKLDAKRIKHIEILKDAAAIAAYGSRAVNGVVLIETDLTDKERKAFVKHKKAEQQP